jgi:DNA modification methylase
MRNNLVKKIETVDWEFLKDYTQSDTHDFHRYSSKFIPQIARNLIEIFSDPGELVLDVFLGSGTTCVEAELANRKCIGVDLNPLAYLISKVKSTPIRDHYLDKEVIQYLEEIRTKIFIYRKGGGRLDLPVFPNIEKWFQPQVLKELTIIEKEINKIGNNKIKFFFICAFSAILRGVSNAHSGYGNLMINKDKRKVSDTFEAFERKIMSMVEGMKSFNKKVKKSTARIYCADARRLSFIKDDSIDLIVTHPPYISAVPYAEYQKLSLNWVKEAFLDIFDKKCIDYLDPKFLDKEIIGGQRAKNNTVERFQTSMELVFREMYRVMKKGSFACVVIGHPTVRGKKIELSVDFVNVAERIGFSHFHTIRRNNHRTTMGKMKKEYILIFRK